MLILPAEADESVVGSVADRITKTVSEGGGAVVGVEVAGGDLTPLHGVQGQLDPVAALSDL